MNASSFRYFLNYSKALNYPRQIAKGIFSLVYPAVIRIWKLPSVKSIEETIRELYKPETSIVRYGDSEMLFIANKLTLPYQEYDPALAQRLAEMLKSDVPNILVGLPDA